jgi:hypothetical protein
MSSDMAFQLTDLLRSNADLRVVNKQTLLQLEEARAQLEQSRVELEVAKAAQLQAAAARAEAQASLSELQAAHQEQLEQIETLRSDLINVVVDNAGPDEEEPPAHAPAAPIIEYAPGVGGVDLRPTLAGGSGRASSVQLSISTRTSAGVLERLPPEVVNYGPPPAPLNPSPRALRNASPRIASSSQPSHQPPAVVDLEVDHKRTGGCCSVQ